MEKAKLSIFVAGLWRGGASKPPNAPDVTGIDPGGGGPSAGTARPGVWRQQRSSMGSWLCSFQGKPPTSFFPGSLVESAGRWLCPPDLGVEGMAGASEFHLALEG